MLTASIAVTPTVAVAQEKISPEKLELAKKKFFEGLDLEKEGKWDEALKRFQDVAAVRITPQVRFHIALCEENSGLLLEAAHDYELAEKDAKASKVTTVATEAPERATAVKAKIPKLKLRLPSDVESATVTIDGSPVDATADDLPVNPGEHKVEATADKRVKFSVTVTVEASSSKTVLIKLPLVAAPVDDTPPPPKDEPKKAESSGIPLPAIIAGSVGVAALIGGGVFAGLRAGVVSDLDSQCTNLRCPAGSDGKINDGKTFTLLTNVFFITGIVGVGTGVVLWVATPRGGGKDKDKDKAAALGVVDDRRSAARISLQPTAPGANVGGLSLVGSF
jgi:hypothetical protein